MKVISVIFRQLAHGLRNYIISREKNRKISMGGVSGYSTFFRKPNGDYSTSLLQGHDNLTAENDTVVLGPRAVTRKGNINDICFAREATDIALVEAFEACAIYE